MIKSEITKIGTFNVSTGMPFGWEFKCGSQDDFCEFELLPDSIQPHSFSTEMTVAGWRLSELREIYRKDFNQRLGLPENADFVINGRSY